ncbi:hypothetical protein [Aeromicrobium sp. Leaf350]|uniref:hypothetical protein n=1 Tax=Aeromicrobium sp. Leaf350 TaxID=2876565 RepID=UPI001E2F089B|nr:hypothetical protein [Aeromicrobium sp. Leaf350]
MAGMAAPAALAQRDLTLAGAACGAALLIGAAALLDLADGRLGVVTSVAVVMASLTVPLAVAPHQLWNTLFAPPVLLVGTLVVVAMVAPGAIAPDGMPESAGRAGRVLAGTVSNGITLALAEVLALAAIGLRRLGLR